MVARILVIASVACVFNLANGHSAPFPGFKPCKSSDDTCILQNVNYGIETFVAGKEDLGIKSSDPDYHEIIDASTPSLKFILSHITVSGIKTCKGVKVKRDESKLQMYLAFQCNLTLEGDYKMEGEMLSVKIEGDDKIRVELPNIISAVDCHYNYKEGKDGKKHLRIKNFEHSYELKEKANIVFKGLFPGNEVLRTAVNQVVTEHPSEVIKQVGPKIFNAVVKRMVENMNNFFGIYPYEELSLD